MRQKSPNAAPANNTPNSRDEIIDEEPFDAPPKDPKTDRYTLNDIPKTKDVFKRSLFLAL